MRIEVVDDRPCPCCEAVDCHCKFYKVGQRVFTEGGTQKGGVICSYHWTDVTGKVADPE